MTKVMTKVVTQFGGLRHCPMLRQALEQPRRYQL